MNPYHTYNTEQFLNDPFFIEWVQKHTPESELFWSNWQNTNPENLSLFKEAEIQLRTILSAKRVDISSDIQDEVWERIQSSIQAEKKLRNIYSSRTKWLAAASIVLLVGLAYWFWQSPSKEIKKELQIASSQNKPILPGGNKALLTLADGSTIVLDSAMDGTLSTQGTVKVIKLDDGKLAYQDANTSGNAIEMTYNTISTPRGGQYKLLLADGTAVWLNAESSLRFPTQFLGKDRTVALTGEGYFEVAKNAAMPFKVQVDDMEVKVLGTHFNVNAYADEKAIKTTLLEGSVEVSSNSQNKKIKPGEQAKLADNGSLLVSHVDVSEVVAWKEGYFSFNNANIKEVMLQLSRWYDIEVVYSGNITNRKFSGSIARNSDLKEVLTILKETDIHFKIEGKRLLVSP
ncbi:MAG: FecR family protein [Chitinophagaceae bacterium]|nr:MAG: FecR family protein [Chitinophagaceae bacterium]